MPSNFAVNIIWEFDCEMRKREKSRNDSHLDIKSSLLNIVTKTYLLNLFENRLEHEKQYYERGVIGSVLKLILGTKGKLFVVSDHLE